MLSDMIETYANVLESIACEELWSTHAGDMLVCDHEKTLPSCTRNKTT